MTQPVRLDPARRAQAAEMLTRAFTEDPAYSYIFPDEAERARSTRKLWHAVIGFCLTYGEVWTTPELAGAAGWLAPGKASFSLGQMVRTGFELPRAWLQFGGSGRRRAMEIMVYLERLHKSGMPGPHWYLQVLGVEPALQGQGIGGRLLQPVLARADAAGLPCYLETESERNVTFYRRHGFEVLTEGPAPGHDVMLWTMARTPRT